MRTATERMHSPATPSHNLLKSHLYAVLLSIVASSAAQSSTHLSAQTNDWHHHRYDVSAQHDIEDSDELFRKIYGEDFIDEYRLLPALGEASFLPRSGYWYPESKQGLNTTDVLTKYDYAFNQGKNLAYSWEAQNRHSQVSWHGHCNGYAASALRHREPKHDVQVGDVIFTRKDIKALLTSIYMGVRYRFLGGRRCEHDPTKPLLPDDRQACDDINAALFHVVLANWVGVRKQAIIFDRNADFQVWNFPLYGYQSQATPITAQQAMQHLGYSNSSYTVNPQATRFLHVSTTVFYADAVNEGEVLDHTEEALENYKYVLELDDEGRIIGGEWTLASRSWRPDFLWVPLRIHSSGVERQRANPHVDPQRVLQLWADSRGLESPEDEPSPYDLFDFTSTWGKFSFYTMTMGHLTSGSAFAFLPTVLNLFFQPLISIGSSHNALTINLDGQPFATPYLMDGTRTSLLLPGGEPGITRYQLHWNFPNLDNSENNHTVGIYTME